MHTPADACLFGGHRETGGWQLVLPLMGEGVLASWRMECPKCAERPVFTGENAKWGRGTCRSIQQSAPTARRGRRGRRNIQRKMLCRGVFPGEQWICSHTRLEGEWGNPGMTLANDS